MSCSSSSPDDWNVAIIYMSLSDDLQNIEKTLSNNNSSSGENFLPGAW